MSLGMLGMMAAGGTVAYADQENRRVDQENQLKTAIFSAEMQDAFAQRREERAATREGSAYKQKRADQLADETRKWERDDVTDERKMKHELSKVDRQAAHSMKQVGAQQAGADRRAGILAQARTGAKGDPDGTAALHKANEQDRDKMVKLQKELTDPMVARDKEYSKTVQERIKGLRDNVKAREQQMRGDSTPKMKGGALNLKDIESFLADEEKVISRAHMVPE